MPHELIPYRRFKLYVEAWAGPARTDVARDAAHSPRASAGTRPDARREPDTLRTTEFSVQFSPIRSIRAGYFLRFPCPSRTHGDFPVGGQQRNKSAFRGARGAQDGKR